jgi:hypothetical protein
MAAQELHQLTALSGSVLSTDLLPVVRGTDDMQQATLAQVGATSKWKSPVRTVDTASLSLATGYANGQTVGGVVVATNDRILRATPGGHVDDGLYIAPASGAASRAVDAPSGGTTELMAGATVVCTEGSYSRTHWLLGTTGTLSIGTTAQEWVRGADSPKNLIHGRHRTPVGFSTTENWMDIGLIVHPTTGSNFIANEARLCASLWPWDDAVIPTKIRLQVVTAVNPSKCVVAIYRRTPTSGIGARVFRDDTIIGNTTGFKTVTGLSISALRHLEPIWLGVFWDSAVVVLMGHSLVRIGLAGVASTLPLITLQKTSETYAGVFGTSLTESEWSWMNGSGISCVQAGL